MWRTCGGGATLHIRLQPRFPNGAIGVCGRPCHELLQLIQVDFTARGCSASSTGVLGGDAAYVVASSTDIILK
jgi:hypothetical protein